MAVEEYLLENFKQDIFLLWQNQSAVIVGRYQNALAEINFEFIEENNIKVVRRLTGGGAVFHDLGNLNFTFIKNGANPNFKEFTAPIIGLLNTMGVEACFQGRNDIVIDGKKISGNAMLVSGNRTLEHGTLLFSAHMANLASALKANPLKFEDKAVKSIKNRVTNISNYLKEEMSVLEFRDKIVSYMSKHVDSFEEYKFTDEDIANIQKLTKDKYSTWDWNFGKSPNYSYAKMTRTAGGNLEIHLNIINGVIEDVKIFGDFFGKNINQLETHLKGCNHNQESIEKRLNELNISNYINNISNEDILRNIMN